MENTDSQQLKPLLPIWARIPIFLFAFFILAGVFQLIGMVVHGINIMGLEQLQQIGVVAELLIQFWMLIPLLILVYVFRKFIDRKTIFSMGFSVKNRGIDFLWGLVLALLIIGGGSLLLYAFGLIDFTFVGMGLSNFGLSLLVFVLVAFNEELMMRGYILNNLLGSANRYVALAISAIIFAGMHGLNPGLTWLAFLNLFLAGIVLGSTYIFSQNLWFPISLHLFWNFLQGPVFGFEVSGNESDSLLAVQLFGSKLWNGGNFGFEGSLLCTILLVVFSAGIFVYFELQRKNIQTVGNQKSISVDS